MSIDITHREVLEFGGPLRHTRIGITTFDSGNAQLNISVSGMETWLSINTADLRKLGEAAIRSADAADAKALKEAT